MNQKDKSGKSKLKIALTMGDPAGIGPELAVRAATDAAFCDRAEIIVYGCPDIIAAAAEKFTGGKMPPSICQTGDLKFNNVPIGKVDAACGAAAREAVITATKDVLAGKVDAIVTTPMNKASVNRAGIPFTGHTELIAQLCKCNSYAMMQSAGNLRIVFVTTHIALSEVVEAITAERIIEVTELLNDAIKAEGIKHPSLAIAAINPHAGEDGYMGDADENIVKPVIDLLGQRGINITGPFPPDTLFIKSTREKFDGIISMYHDQGHIPFKMLAFDRGVNSTLGLPIIRTSVDHGTAFEIAWQGVADMGSLNAALNLAIIRAL
jgi:4-hydroxythreonine-4-phosphate dehydrogenase